MNDRLGLAAQIAAGVPRFVNLTARFQAAVADRLGVAVTDLHALAMLQDPAVNTPGRLARELHLTTGAVTKVLDRLERSRFIEREPDRHDRRRIIVRPRPERMPEVGALYAPMADDLERCLSSGDEAQLRFLLHFITTGAEAAAQQIQALSPTEPEGACSTLP